MLEHSGFLADIIEHPNDDVPRLVYADWLDDQGQELRGEMIRSGCELASLPLAPEHAFRREQLLARITWLQARFGRGWAGRKTRRLLKKNQGRWKLKRGFVDQVKLPATTFRDISDDIFRLCPVRELILGLTTEFSGILNQTESARLQCLTLLEGPTWPHLLVKEYAQLFRVEHLRSVRSLSLDRCWLPPQALESLPGSAVMDGLTSLALNSNSWFSSPRTNEVLAPILSHSSAGNLNCFCARGGPMEDILSALTASPVSDQLEMASFPHLSRMGPPRPVSMPEDKARKLLSGLRSLSFSGSVIGDYLDVPAMLQYPEAASLTRLDLSRTQIDNFSMESVAQAELPSLTELMLAARVLGNRDLEQLAQAPCLRGVTVLDLSDCSINAKGARELFASENLLSLHRLSLRANPIGIRGIEHLLSFDGIANLWWLDLRSTGLTDVALPLLVRLAKLCPKIAWLDLRQNNLSAGCCAQLRATFGATVRYTSKTSEVT